MWLIAAEFDPGRWMAAEMVVGALGLGLLIGFMAGMVCARWMRPTRKNRDSRKTKF